MTIQQIYEKCCPTDKIQVWSFDLVTSRHLSSHLCSYPIYSRRWKDEDQFEQWRSTGAAALSPQFCADNYKFRNAEMAVKECPWQLLFNFSNKSNHSISVGWWWSNQTIERRATSSQDLLTREKYQIMLNNLFWIAQVKSIGWISKLTEYGERSFIFCLRSVCSKRWLSIGQERSRAMCRLLVPFHRQTVSNFASSG